jgi:putative ABC transport system permease protein
MLGGMSFLAVLVGSVGIMNAMLMAVLERTREIGTLRSLGWKKGAVIGMIIREALLLGILGGLTGIPIALGFIFALRASPNYGDVIDITISLEAFINAIIISLVLGVVGGIYPAIRANRMQPVEALRYE